MIKIDKAVRVGTNKNGNFYVTVKYDGKRLSICGVEGPKRNGDANGSFGQCLDVLCGKDFWPTEGIDVSRLLASWEDWHLNDMRAGCPHQKDWDTQEKVEIVTYCLKTKTIIEQNKIKDSVTKQVLATGKASISDYERQVLALPFTITEAPDADSEASGHYTVYKRETKTAGWLYESEHPKGLLCKPCPQCGHKYGSAWLFEEVPANVLEFLESLPDDTSTCPWGL